MYRDRNAQKNQDPNAHNVAGSLIYVLQVKHSPQTVVNHVGFYLSDERCKLKPLLQTLVGHSGPPVKLRV